MSLVLTSISPLSGPPGAAITCVGSGFATTSRVVCPSVVATTYVDATPLTAESPAVAGPAGGSLPIQVFVLQTDGSVSNALPFTVLFPTVLLQAWTDAASVAAEIPGFARGGQIKDAQIQTWIRSVGQEIAAEMLRRGLSTDPTTWSQGGVQGTPNPVDVLEMLNRMGAAARLASAVGAQFAGQGEWGVAKACREAYLRQLAALRGGDYDKFFLPGAVTVEPGRQFGYGDMSGCDGDVDPAFRKDKRF